MMQKREFLITTIVAAVIACAVAFAWAGAPANEWEKDGRPHIVVIVGEDEYHAEETLSRFAELLQNDYGCRCTVVKGHGADGIPGLEVLKTADAAMLFVRRRALPKEQLQIIRDYLDAGGPLVALRTASHAFAIKGETPPGCAQWPEFDHEVLGGNYHDHARGKSEINVASGAAGNAILAKVEPLRWTSSGTMYYTSPVDKQATVLLTASCGDKTEPAAWTRVYKKSRVFYTSLGHRDDFETPQFRRLLVNAIFWAMDRPAP
jgi:type 1 glutamine amidotransferase